MIPSKTITKEVSFLAINLKRLRKRKGLTQEAFGKAVNIKRSSIGAYEEGRAEPSISVLIEISSYFGISIDKLVKTEAMP